MNKVVVFGVYVVGMYYLGGIEFRVGEVNYVRNEFLNLKDKYVVVVFVDRDCFYKWVNLRWKDLFYVFRLFEENFIYDKCYIKLKGVVEKFS